LLKFGIYYLLNIDVAPGSLGLATIYIVMILSFPPPKHWQDFETLTKDIARYKLEGDFENYGRLGQSQNGVDIYGWDKQNQNTGLQCKHKTSAGATSGKIVTDISIEMIDNELKLADKFTPKLKKFIIATTSLRDTKIQNHIFEVNEKRKNDVLPILSLWSWEIFEEELNKHAELSYIYYENILKSLHHYNKDLHILSLLKHSLDRPAFNTFFHVENHSDHFIQAISDTQRAFATGKLYDRDGNLIGSAYPSKKLADKNDREMLEKAEKNLQEIRTFVTQQVRDGNIIQRGNFLEFRHDWELKISQCLNNKRRELLEMVNIVLHKYSIEELKSPLLREN